ncbi:MAG: alpha/beta fold hydrolase [Mycobacteriales bacterium]
MAPPDPGRPPAGAVRWRTVRVAGARVEFAEVGDPAADPLIFLHGWGLTPRTYLSAIAPLVAAGVRVVAPSLPGCGGSDPLGLRSGLAAYAARVGAAVDELGVGRAFVAGHSFGGGVALQLAAARPDLVRSLTLVNTVGGAPGERAAMTQHSWAWWALGAATELDPRQLLHLCPRLARDFVPNLVRHPLAVSAAAVVAMRASLADEAAGLVAAGLPVLFIWGDRDRLTAPGVLSEVADHLGPEIVHGRHGWMLNQPAEFAELLRNALVVHVLLERQRRGQVTGTVTRETPLADLLDATGAVP